MEDFKKGDKKSFLDYEIIYCTNNDGIVLMKDRKRPKEAYECHLGNYSTLDHAQQAAIVYFMIARPEIFATQIFHKVMRNGSGCMSEFGSLVNCLKAEGLEMPEEITPVDSLNRLIGYKGKIITWQKN